MLYKGPETQLEEPKARVEYDKNISEHRKRIRTRKKGNRKHL